MSEIHAIRLPSAEEEKDVRKLGLSEDRLAALGPLVAVHRTGSGFHKGVFIAIPAVFTAFFGGILLFLLVRDWQQIAANPGNAGGLIALAVLLVLFLLPFVGLVFGLRALAHRLYLFENGVVLDRGRKRVVLWADVDHVIAGGLNNHSILQVMLADKTKLTIDNTFRDYRAISGAIRTAVTGHIVTRIDAAFARGEAVPFRKMLVSKSGLEQEGEPPLPWSDVKKMTIEWRGRGDVAYTALVIRWPADDGTLAEWAEKQIGRFPNFDAFLAVAERYTTIELGEGVAG